MRTVSTGHDERGTMTATRGLVIVGAGFAGFWAAAAARRFAGSELPIRLVAPEPSLVIRPRLYEAHPETLAVDLRPLLATLDVGFITASAVALDRDTVVLSTGERVAYDRLVVATGSVMQRPSFAGVELTFTVDSQSEAVAFDRRLLEIATEASADKARTPCIAVIGAGFTGIELALELRDRIAAHTTSSIVPDVAQRLRIVLVDRADVVGVELGEGPRPLIEEALNEARVELRLGSGVSSLDERLHELVDGERVQVDAVVLATGLVASSFVSEVPGERDHAGRILVDRYLRAPDAGHIFLAGDTGAADVGDGHRTLASCQHALQLGRVAGENAARDLQGRPLVPYEQLRYVTCLDLGRSGAVLTSGWDRAVVQAGPDTKRLKVRINTEIIYPPIDGSLEELLRQSELDPEARTAS